MKAYFKILIAVLSLFFYTDIVAQQYGSPYGRSPGVDRSVGRGQYSNGPKKTEKIDYVELAIDKLEKELVLDAFQKAIIKDALVKNSNEETKIVAMDIPDDSKLEKILTLREKLDVEINKILSPDQIEKFKKFRSKTKVK